MSDEPQRFVRLEDLVRHRLQFDYFITGGAGAALAYAIQTYDSSTTPNYAFLAPIGWALLAIALAAGLWAISRNLEVLGTIGFAQASAEQLAAMRVALYEGRDYVDRYDGKVTVVGELLPAIKELDESSVLELDDLSTVVRGVELEKVRNVALVAGFIVLGLWRTLNL